MKEKKRARQPELFRGNSEGRFNTCVGLVSLGIVDSETIRRYLGVDSQMLKKWRCCSPHKEIFAKRLEEFRAEFASDSPTARLKKLKVDCGIRHLLRKQDVRFMRDFSTYLDAAADDEANGASANRSEIVRSAIETAAEIVDLDADAFQKALLERLQSSNGIQ